MNNDNEKEGSVKRVGFNFQNGKRKGKKKSYTVVCKLLIKLYKFTKCNKPYDEPMKSEYIFSV